MYPIEKRVEALRILGEHGGCVRSAAREAGVAHATLAAWARGSAMGLGRKPAVYLAPEQKAGAVSRVLRGEAPAAVAASAGVAVGTLSGWVRAARSGAWEGVLGMAAEERPLPAGLPDDPEALKAIIRDMQFRLDLAREVVEVVKKDPGADPSALTNREKALLVNALRGAYSVTSLTSSLGIAPSSYHYWRARLAAPDPLAALRREVARVFEASGRAWGYRRVWRQLRSEGTRVSEKVVRRLMREGGMAVAYDRKRRRSYDSYAGEVSDRPPNLLYLEEEGREPGHAFEAALPNEVWVTDITEFRLPCGAKVYLSPVLDCFDGRLASWGVGLHPTAALAEGALREACAGLARGEAPVVHSDGGVQYRVGGWEACCAEFGLTRSMSRKGTSGDNARMEGFFGTLKNEFFYHRDWRGVTPEEFMRRLEGFLVYYNDERPKASLGWLSPKRYREALGFAA